MIYNKLIEYYFFNTRHGGSLDKKRLKTVILNSEIHGSGGHIQLGIECKDDGIITKARFKARGNPFIIAILEWLCCQLEGDNIQLHPRFNYDDFMRIFEIPETNYSFSLRIVDMYHKLTNKMQEKIKRDKS